MEKIEKKSNKFLAKNSKLLFLIASVFVGFLVGAIALKFAGYNPIEAYIVLFKGMFNRPKNIGWLIVNATPIIFTGLGVAFAFKTGLFNIGAEGQYMVGSIVAFIIGYSFDMPAVIHIPFTIIMAILFGAIYGGIVGIIKAKAGMHEVITSIMLNWIAFYLVNFITNLKQFKMPNSFGTFEIKDTAKIRLFDDISNNFAEPFKNFFSAPLHFGIVLAIIMAILVWFILNKTTLGFKLKAVGFNQEASEYAGINTNKKLFQSMAISGGLCALGGACQVMGFSYSISVLTSMENFGFDGLAVALLAGNNPIGCIFSGLFFGGLNYAGSNVQRVLHAPSEMIKIIMGTIILFSAIPLAFKIIKAKINKRRAKK